MGARRLKYLMRVPLFIAYSAAFSTSYAVEPLCLLVSTRALTARAFETVFPVNHGGSATRFESNATPRCAGFNKLHRG